MGESELKGKKVTLIRMEDPYTDLRSGSTGIIEGEDDLGHILVKWDNGSSLNLIPDIDEYTIHESIKRNRIVGFKKFNELNTSGIYDIDYITTKSEELADLFRGESVPVINMDIMDNSVKFDIGIGEDAYVFLIDFDSEMVYKLASYGIVGPPEEAHEDKEWEFEGVDAGFEILEKEFHKILRISERIKIKKGYI